ncbi:phosphoribosylaminoimidazole carboxylase ATPase subunit [Neokomagataea thailandica NBRC 106555]|uniref:N5-carboxyaminoimidazole ribonucleotide synthase n=2 Tax=Neokomagataea TaxID=1223423 RepID=A0A4Y6VBC5_9PROT|nr:MULTISPECIES: 5-(carboxyamino)imidazole ribonucleotide synthase [Neokomagataea]QDH25675.1 5-(carboxyamino)imidazole ribonucleotide synthase [Neokomagataea tanensis]GBR55298.1 phosphoribosylaminoimidazole carboxylase ATPase subunit [Neokomagataea thailandica NBRC 106555]
MSASAEVFPPGRTIGIVGGGQLGRMSAMAAARLGYRVHILNTAATSPAIEVAASATIGSYDDPDTLKAFAEKCDVVTFEFENVSAEGLALLEHYRPVRPSGAILQVSQDRILEKTRLAKAGVALAPWLVINGPEDLEKLPDFGFPVILKTTRFGYDGKGQFRVANAEELSELADLPYPLVAEKKIDFARELSVMVARGLDGQVRCFDTVENRHRDGILDITLAPAPIEPALAYEAQNMATKIAEELALVGLMGVEMFHAFDGTLLVNEIAPRPHNSGHWTMNACLVDQFEMHIRAVTGLPLPPATRHSDAIMHNLIGPDDMARVPSILAAEGAALHLYGKNDARVGRKMGHVNTIFPKGALPGELALSSILPK